MDNQNIVAQWHEKILSVCESKLERKLSGVERKFILDHGGFIALELIEDSVATMSSEELQAFLNSETAGDCPLCQYNLRHLPD